SSPKTPGNGSPDFQPESRILQSPHGRQVKGGVSPHTETTRSSVASVPETSVAEQTRRTTLQYRPAHRLEMHELEIRGRGDGEVRDGGLGKDPAGRAVVRQPGRSARIPYGAQGRGVRGGCCTGGDRDGCGRYYGSRGVAQGQSPGAGRAGRSVKGVARVVRSVGDPSVGELGGVVDAASPSRHAIAI